MPARSHARRLPALVLCLCLPRLLAADTLVPLPATGAEPVLLYLELVVNGRASGEVVPVTQRGHHYEIDAEVLRRLHVQNTRPAGSRLAVDSLPGVATEYDGLGQRLLITVPTDWLPLQAFDTPPHLRRAELADGTGLLLNYDAYTTTSRGSSLRSLWTEQRVFGRLGTLSNTGLYRSTSSGAADGYLRYDTRWTRVDPDDASQRVVGDVVTGALPWTSAVRLGGVQWSRNFGIRPDLVTYPLPQFAGQAAVPSAVDLFVNGYRAAARPVEAGPFSLGELPIVNGAGTATVVATDALGRQVLTALPFYVSQQLLRPGLVDYSFSAGALRRGYGLRSVGYGRAVASGVVRQGWSDSLTVEAQAQVGRGLAVAGIGGLVKAGLVGTLNASLSRGRADAGGPGVSPAFGNGNPDAGRGGWQYSAGYQYTGTVGSVSLQQIGRTAGYGDAGTYADDGFRLQRRTRQLSGSLPVGRGSVSAGWVDLQGGIAGGRTRLAYASYSRPLSDRVYLSMTAGRTVETGDTQVRLQLTYMLDSRASVSTAAVRSNDSTRAQATYQDAVPSDGGFGWNITQSLGGDSAERYRAAAVQYRNDVALVQGGVYGTGDQTARWAGASGSLGLMDGHAFAANRIGDGFALVSTGGVPNVPVRFEQQLIGRTDAQGYLLVPQVPAYRNGRYELDLLDLPADRFAPVTERQVAVRGGMGALVEIPVQTLRSATIALVDALGVPLPVGTPVRHAEAGTDTLVGWDGVVFLGQMQPQNTLLARPQNGVLCQAGFSARMYDEEGLRQVVCRPQAQGGPAVQGASGLPGVQGGADAATGGARR
ncbi:fimbria/pilus outer membrane usher protein [Xylophilus sp. Leaf220]|uniref:fimbria/pilus outer membrane usher protein n=1 Tax=Xylophilus sp. Leaf220 TaxID=1735686 RepID=UPI001F00A34F|nr:fimbria/pilus outer membrane usher protein [Xylophilus sp. Leaf220]